ncbi:MAG: imidazole glycerol phosphate synthase subunit HisH [Propionibacteriaceae bacterium]|nr:imidazole glycerol phosphate synthase subunit HisH [Propionibacteriaceae bacterium]
MTPAVAVLDYGSGNLHSVVRALAAAGADVALTADSDAALAADGLVVPGVGAFAACMGQLRAVGGDEMLKERARLGKPLLGICVGHQILFREGAEHGLRTAGVGLFPGAVEKLPAGRLPHMGWNEVRPPQGSALFAGVEGERFYFVHSYAALDPGGLPPAAAAAWSVHDGASFIAAVEYGPIASVQFHPEKSGPAGARLLRNWVAGLAAP